MLYQLDSKEDAARYSEIAIQLMDSYGLPATPDFYRLFYDYVSERDPVVVARLRDVADETPDRFRAAAEAVLTDHYGMERDTQILTATGEAMQDQIRNVVRNVQAAGSDVGAFGNALNGLESGLGVIGDEGRVKSIATQMLVATQQMKTRSEKLEQDLKQSANEITNLQEKLAESRCEALTDALTGLSNRAGFDKSLMQHTATAREKKMPLSLVICDIDHFKKFNDTYGHQLGDQVLRLVGSVLSQGLKGRDVPCRYGGEEFALILPETDIKAAARVADLIRQDIAAKRIVRKRTGEEISQVTMSFGVAHFKPDEAPAALIKRADEALYRSKENGRNQVTMEENTEPKLAVAI